MRYPKPNDNYSCEVLCENFMEIEKRLDALGDGGGSVEVDNELSETSTNPVQNKVVKAEFDKVKRDLDEKYVRLESVDEFFDKVTSQIPIFCFLSRTCLRELGISVAESTYIPGWVCNHKPGHYMLQFVINGTRLIYGELDNDEIFTYEEVYTRDEINKKLAEKQPKGDYALRSEIPDVSVISVNGKTGEVNLIAEDVGAATSEEVSSLKSDLNELDLETAHYITPEMYGAVGDGVTDDSVAIQTAINNAGSTKVVYLASKVYKISNGLNFSSNYAQFKCDGEISYDGTDSAIKLTNGYCMNIEIEKITASYGTAVRLDGSNNTVNHNIVKVNTIRDSKTALDLYTNNQSMCYNKFYVNKISATETGVKIWADASYINENWFFLGIISGGCNKGIHIYSDHDLNVGQGYGANDNHFFRGSFEGIADDGCAIYLDRTHGNKFDNMRCQESYGKNSIVFNGRCVNNDFSLSRICLEEVDITNLESGSNGNKLFSNGLTASKANGYSAGVMASVRYVEGITYNPIYSNITLTLRANTYSDNVIKQINGEIFTTIYLNYMELNGLTYKLGELYSEDGSLTRGFPLVMKFASGKGHIILNDSRGDLIFDNSDGKYDGKTVSVKWNGYNKIDSKNIWDIQIVGETYASEEYVKSYAQPKGNYLTEHQSLSGYAKTADISTHNVSESAHNDMRLLINGLITRLNALANSDDTTLDQMAEVVAYIKNNKSLIDGITTSKVSVTDIIDNLTTSASNKPLSAKQGVALKALIDAIVVPTKTSQLTNDSGFLTQHQSLTGYAKTADHYTKTESDNKYQTKGNYLTSVPSEYVTETELDAKGYLASVPSEYAKTSDHYTKTESDNKYQTKGNYLTSVPSEYVTETELSAKGYAVKSSAETWTFTLADGSTVTKKVVLA